MWLTSHVSGQVYKKAHKINRRTLRNLTLWLWSIMLNPINSKQSSLPFCYKLVFSAPLAFLPSLLWAESLWVGRGGSVNPQKRIWWAVAQKKLREKIGLCLLRSISGFVLNSRGQFKNEKLSHLPCDFIWYLLMYFSSVSFLSSSKIGMNVTLWCSKHSSVI